MEKKLNILFGISDSVVDSIIAKLKSTGYEVDAAFKYTKVSIQEYVNSHPECNTVILKEVLESSKYSAQELSWLTDMRDVNVIIVVNEEKRGTDFMRVLYSAGITSAIFQRGRNGGASVSQICDLIVSKRTRKEARRYYAIGENLIELDMLPFDLLHTYLEALDDELYGRNITERFICVVSKLTPRQIAQFIEALPKDKIKELEEYEEFFEIIGILKGFKIDLKIKRPKKLKKNSELLSSSGFSQSADQRKHATDPEEKNDKADSDISSEKAFESFFFEGEDEDDDNAPDFEAFMKERKQEEVKEEPKRKHRFFGKRR